MADSAFGDEVLNGPRKAAGRSAHPCADEAATSASADLFLPCWPASPESPALPPAEVHVWRASLDAAPEARDLSSALSADERDRAARFRREQDRRRFVAARGVLRAILGRYLAVEPRSVSFRYNRWGKPFLSEAFESGGLAFNLSHARGLALYAVARNRQVGVDVEYVDEGLDWPPIAERFFCASEAAALSALPEAARRPAFFRCWTRKEAYVKARGEGMSLALDAFAVSVAPEDPPRLLNARDGPADLSRWSLADVDVGPRYAAAVAVEGRDWRLKFWRWDA